MEGNRNSKYNNRENGMKSKKKKKKITIKDIIRLIVLLVAFSVLLYPTFSSYLNEKNGSKVVSYYDEESVKLSKAEKEQMLEDARAYNQEMLGNIDLIDPFSQEDVEIDARYEGLLNVDGSGMMGYIRIPKINIELPIYHGTSETVLQAGVGHFWGTSLPVGGESTHTVLTGHRGLPTKTLFTNMDKLEVGDIFYIKVLDETLAYQIDQILTVLPQETDSLSIEPGKDYATLVTCTPFAINTLVLKNYMRNVCLGNDEPSEYSGAKQARKILEQAAALFASGTMNNEDKTTFMDEMTRLYLASKRTEENGKKK